MSPRQLGHESGAAARIARTSSLASRWSSFDDDPPRIETRRQKIHLVSSGHVFFADHGSRDVCDQYVHTIPRMMYTYGIDFEPFFTSIAPPHK